MCTLTGKGGGGGGGANPPGQGVDKPTTGARSAGGSFGPELTAEAQ